MKRFTTSMGILCHITRTHPEIPQDQKKSYRAVIHKMAREGRKLKENLEKRSKNQLVEKNSKIELEANFGGFSQ